MSDDGDATGRRDGDAAGGSGDANAARPSEAASNDRDDPPAIEVDSVAVAYGDEPVLESVSASVARGEFVGLVGPNGAGKTTLLRTITGTLAPDEGSVSLDGDDVRDLSSAAASRRVAVVPQETAQSFAFTVREVVEMGRHPHRSRFESPGLRDRALVERAMERTRTARFADRPVTDVSGGERQRVLLARALAQDAPTLLLDEPTASLDVDHAVDTMSIVRDRVDAGRTAVAAIHDLELAARFCDRLLLLAGGDVVARGPPAEVLESDAIAAAFGADVAVEPEPVGGGVAVRAVERPGGAVADRRVHVVGSGQPAAAAVGALGNAGAALSLGPVPRGDRAAATARAFDAPVVDVPPFAPVGGDALEDARALADDADVVVLAAAGSDGLPEPWRATCLGQERLVAFEMGSATDRDGISAIRVESRDELLAVVEEIEARADATSGTVASDAPVADGGERDD